MLPFTHHSIHRLRAELLESRCMLSMMRIGAWNTANHPNPTVVEVALLSTRETSLGETSPANIYFQSLPKLERAVHRSDQRSSFVDRYFAIFAEDEEVV